MVQLANQPHGGLGIADVEKERIVAVPQCRFPSAADIPAGNYG
jgi:hypothetical protein